MKSHKMPIDFPDNCQTCGVGIETGKLVSHIEDYHVGPKHQEGIVITCGFSGCPYTVTLTDSGLERMIRHCNATRHDPTGMKINWDSFFNAENKRLRELVKFGVRLGGDRQIIQPQPPAREAVPATPNYRRRSDHGFSRRSPPARFARPPPPPRSQPSGPPPQKRSRPSEQTPRRERVSPQGSPPAAQPAGRGRLNESSMSELENSLAASTFKKDRTEPSRPDDPIPSASDTSTTEGPSNTRPSADDSQSERMIGKDENVIKQEVAESKESPPHDETMNSLEKELAGVGEDADPAAQSALKMDTISCTFCSYSATGTNLRNRMVDHVFSHDRGLTPFRCRSCDYVTTRISSIERHAKSDSNKCDGSFDNIQTNEMIRRTRILLCQAFPDADWDTYSPPRGQIARIKLDILE